MSGSGLPVMAAIIDFMTQYGGWLLGASVLSVLAALVLVPAFVVRIPTDYFSAHTAPGRVSARRPVLRLAIVFGRNLLGLVVIVIGILLLVLPGQGLLTIVIGLMIMDFPGKYRIERWLVSKRVVLSAMNWLRARSGRPPLDFS